MNLLQRWRSGPRRLRLRRRLLVFSAPVAMLMIVAIVKSLSVVIAGDSAVSAYAQRDNGALRGAVDSLTVLNVVEPAKAPFAAGGLAVLDNRLAEADRQFSESLSRTESAEACAVRINLELVRETLGDRAAAAFDAQTAVTRYLSARTTVEQAESGCFAGNTDPNSQRRAVRNDALRRLDQKIAAVQVAPPPPPPPPVAEPVPAPSAQPGEPADRETTLRLEPDAGTPLDRLRKILRDAAGDGQRAPN